MYKKQSPIFEIQLLLVFPVGKLVSVAPINFLIFPTIFSTLYTTFREGRRCPPEVSVLVNVVSVLCFPSCSQTVPQGIKTLFPIGTLK